MQIERHHWNKTQSSRAAGKQQVPCSNFKSSTGNTVPSPFERKLLTLRRFSEEKSFQNVYRRLQFSIIKVPCEKLHN